MGLTASIVIVFHNEGFSTLMRNVHQVQQLNKHSLIALNFYRKSAKTCKYFVGFGAHAVGNRS